MLNPFSNPSYLLPPLAVCVVSLILIALVWRGPRDSFSRWLFLGLLLSIGLWSSFIFGMRASLSLDQALLWEKATPMFFHVSFVFYYHFTLVYTKNKGQRRILLAAYLSVLVTAALSFTDLIIAGMRLEYYGYAPVLGPVGLVIGIADLFLMGAGGRNLLKRYNLSLETSFILPQSPSSNAARTKAIGR